MEILQTYPIFVARQPIFDRQDKVWAYELLYRDQEIPNSARIDNPDHATLKVISQGFSVAITATGGRKPVFINFPERLILEKSAFALPSELCVVEVLETVTPDENIVQSCLELQQNGYRIAIDDYFGQPEFERLIKIADIIKVDILKLSPLEIKKLVKSMSKLKAKILAEKIEHLTIYNLCKKIGFDYFQGFFFCMPQIISGSKPSPAKVSSIKLLKELAREDLELSDLSKIIQKDASLSYRLLKFINSAYFGFRNEISSIQQAVTLLGIRQTSQWLRVNILSDMSETPMDSEVTYLAALRGKFLEQVSASHNSPPFDPPSMFLLGLFSLLDTLIGRPMEKILEELPLKEEMKQVLADKSSTSNGYWLKLARFYEKGDWQKTLDTISFLGLDPEETARIYNQSLEWVRSSLASRI